MNKVYITNEQDKIALDAALRGLIRRAIGAALKFEKFEYAAELSVTLTDNERDDGDKRVAPRVRANDLL